MKKIIKIGFGLLIVVTIMAININISENEEGNYLQLENLTALNTAGAIGNPSEGGGGVDDHMFGVYNDYIPCPHPYGDWEWIRNEYNNHCEYVYGNVFSGYDGCWGFE
jgi:restriction endonuclease S subunit